MMNWNVIFLVFVSCVPFKMVNSRVNLPCPSTYTIQMPYKSIVINVKEKKNECRKAQNLSLTKDTSTSQDQTLQTKANLVFVKDENQAKGKYKARINWTYNTSSSQLPRKFLLHLTFHWAERRESRCFQLKVTSDRNQEGDFQKTIPFYFDCVPLLDEPKVYMTVQVWSIPGTASRSCRVARSVPGTGVNCGPEVHCSNKYPYYISKASHKYHQCTCHRKNYGNAQLDLSFKPQSQTFVVSLRNLPPYLGTAEVDIVREDHDNRHSSIPINVWEIRDGAISIETEALGVGNYTAYVCVMPKLFMKCQQDKGTTDIYSTEEGCDTSGDIFLLFSRQNLTIPVDLGPSSVPVTQAQVTLALRLEYILAIVGGIIFTTIVTIIVFLICRCHRQSLSGDSDMLKNTIRRYPAVAEDENEGEEMMEIRKPVSDKREDDQVDETEIYTMNNTPLTDPIQDGYIHHEPLPGNKVPSRGIAEEDSVLLLYHKGRGQDLEKVVEVMHLLEKSGIKIVHVNHVLKHGFPNDIKDIVLVFSKQLYIHCHNFVHDEAIVADPLLSEDVTFGQSFCHLLEKMQEAVQNSEYTNTVEQNPEQTYLLQEDSGQQQSQSHLHSNFCLHLISLNSEDVNIQNMIQSFLTNLRFLSATRNFFPYYFVGNDLTSSDNKELLDVLMMRLKPTAPKNFQRQINNFNAS